MTLLSEILSSGFGSSGSGLLLPISGVEAGGLILPTDAQIIAVVVGAGGSGKHTTGGQSSSTRLAVPGASGAWGIKTFKAKAGDSVTWVPGAPMITSYPDRYGRGVRAGSSYVLHNDVEIIKAEGGECGDLSYEMYNTAGYGHTLPVAQVYGHLLGGSGISTNSNVKHSSAVYGHPLSGAIVQFGYGLAKMLGTFNNIVRDNMDITYNPFAQLLYTGDRVNGYGSGGACDPIRSSYETSAIKGSLGGKGIAGLIIRLEDK